MEKCSFKQLEIDEIQEIGKYIFSVCNGNHILRYSEEEYRNYLKENPSAICQMFIYYFVSANWGYDDPRMFENYDEQWLAVKIDSGFSSDLQFDLDDFDYERLLPYQKAVIDFTEIIIPVIKLKWDHWFKTGTPLEMVYSVFANNLNVDSNGNVLNKEHAISRGMDMIRCCLDDQYKPQVPFEKWELIIY